MKKLLFVFVLFGFQAIYAQNTYVPDDNFENYLETHDAYGNAVSIGDANSLGDGVMNDSVPTAKINGVVFLFVNNMNIADLTGIEDFASLDHLRCDNNSLTTLDLSNNTALAQLECYNNQLSVLNISQNTSLTRLACYHNQLTNLDVSQLTGLTYLGCSNNQITTLDVSNLTALVRLICYNNQITELDVSNSSNLSVLNAFNNHLTTVNVRNGNNANISTFYTTNNPDLTCIFVDDTSASYLSSWHVDATSHFVETQADCNALATGENPYEQAVKLYPNPANNELVISKNTGFEITGITIYNMTGNIVYQTGIISGKINTKHLKNGIYFVQLQGAGHTVTKKFIVEH